MNSTAKQVPDTMRVRVSRKNKGAEQKPAESTSVRPNWLVLANFLDIQEILPEKYRHLLKGKISAK